MILSTGLIVFIVLLLLNICCHCCGFPPRRQNWQVNNTTAMTTDDNSRLDSKVLSSLPIFVHSSTAQEGKLECAVCLGEFKDGDKCRLLPRCNHSFHTDCVDAWFGSHSSCPLCRDTVKSDNPEAAV